MIDFKHTRALIKKNYLVWTRTPCISLVEILSPILICAILVYLRTQIEQEVLPLYDFGEITIEEDGTLGYNTVYHYPLKNLKD